MSSMLGSQGVVLATAMAVSGTVLLLAFRLQKPQFPSSIHQPLRSCISSDVKKAEKKKKKKKKRVHFAEDVVDARGDGEVFRRQHEIAMRNSSSESPTPARSGRKVSGMPENRLALYNGMLRDRVVHRVGYSY